MSNETLSVAKVQSKVGGSFYSSDKHDVKQIRVSEIYQNPILIVASRSHPSLELDSLLEKIKDYKIINIGSSVKFCLVASGKADFYPRFGPTSEWDVAAGEAIVKFAGGHIMTMDGKPMSYNLKEDYLNPSFMVSSNKIVPKKLLSLIE